MAITTNDVKLLASERMTDNEDGGGMVRGNVVIQDGASNAIFPDISELDRTYGRVNLRKVFPAVQTTDTDVYYGAHVIVEDAPDDPLVSATLFSTESWSDERDAAVSRLESYLARGAKVPYYLFEQHISGQMALQCLARVGTDMPSVGSTIVVVKNPGLSTELQQYVRITSVSAFEQDFTYLSGTTSYNFTRLVLTINISDPLEFDVLGGIARPDDDAALTTSRIYATVVADAARYFGIRPLVQAASIGDLSIQADTIYHPLVPSAQTEIPIADAKPHGDSLQLTGARPNTIAVTTAVDFDATHAIYVGQAIYPGTLSVNTGTGATLTDDNGILMSGATQVGLVDYANGILKIDTGGPDYGTATKTITFRPAAAPARQMQSGSVAVTIESRSQSVVAYLDPIPQPGTLKVHFLAQGKWYVLQDNGGGKIKGADESFGSGTLSFTTGSVIVTLGALPDVGSKVIFTYGLATTDIDRSGQTIKAFRKIELPHDAIAEGTLDLEWSNGSGGFYTANDDGHGNIVGDATGTIEYSTGEMVWAPNVLPPGGVELDITYSYGTPLEITFSAPARQGNGWLALNLMDNNITPGSVVVTWNTLVDLQVLDVHYGIAPPERRDPVVWRFDTGTGLLEDALGNDMAASAIDYANGTITFNPDIVEALPIPQYQEARIGTETWADLTLAGVDVSAFPEDTTFAVYRNQLTSIQYTNAASVFPVDDTGWVKVRYRKADSPQGNNYQVTISSLDLDLTPGFNEQVVLGSMRLTFGGKTILDRTGTLVQDLVYSSGAATSCGTMDYGSGDGTLNVWTPGQTNSGTVTSMLTYMVSQPVDTLTFRIAAVPVRPGTFIMQFVRVGEEGISTVTAATNGQISDANVYGHIDYETGIVNLRFGGWVTAAGNESEWWYPSDPAAVVNGKVFKPYMVYTDSLRYACVSYSYLPLDEDILGLNPVRLPTDGRVVIFKPGDVLVVHHNGHIVGTYNNESVNLGRTRVARVRVFDANGALVDPAKYTVDLDAGTVQIGDMTGVAQPIDIEHRIEDMGLCSDAQINGLLTVTRPLTHDYPVPGSQVSSALIIGDMQARYANLFEQSSWTGSWSDIPGSQPTASYNDRDFPVLVDNAGCIQERWALIFTSTTQVRVVGEVVGQIAEAQAISNTIAPNNPATGRPYFTVNPAGWGTGWASGNVLRFNTIASNFPVWLARTIKQGPATEDSDSFCIQIRGDIDTP